MATLHGMHVVLPPTFYKLMSTCSYFCVRRFFVYLMYLRQREAAGRCLMCRAASGT